ncbi:hypothetical protein IE53DRAFT_382509 [Violaceomyces palustris]|uniref:Uncharacterized protein n=1 Tax=Violaceomyces palustris TaxID=1673888 RepID=A0ACD0NM73_9BASI|nr:hypothetical protein IE53DRAFT_382509 [Violaceomyces palustris]
MVKSDDLSPEIRKHLEYPPITPHQNLHGLEIRSDAQRGRGVFTTRPLPLGTILETSPVLLFPPSEYVRHGRFTTLDSYTFVWRRTSEGEIMALALGLGSIFNHDPDSPNVDYRLDRESHRIVYSLVRDVKAGEELCISYGSGRMWWEEEEEERKEVKEEEEFERLAGMMGSDEEKDGDPEEEDEGKGSEGLKDKELEEEEEERRKVGLVMDRLKRRGGGGSTGPMFRVTCSQDPLTVPLSTTKAWVVEILASNSSKAIRFIQESHGLLQNREGCAFPTRHLRAFKSSFTRPKSSKVEEGEEDSGKTIQSSTPPPPPPPPATTTLLICLRQALPNRNSVLALLSRDKEGIFKRPSADPTRGEEEGEDEPDVKLVDVPTTSVPVKERMEEWNSVWPCTLRPNNTNRNLETKTSKAASGGGSCSNPNEEVVKVHGGGGRINVGIVDRRKDEKEWDQAKLEWARNRFRRVVAMARENRSKGQLACATHVTMDYQVFKRLGEEEEEVGGGGEEGYRKGYERDVDWGDLRNDEVMGLGRRTGGGEVVDRDEWLLGRVRRKVKDPFNGFPTSLIQVDGRDCRVEMRNPLKHSVMLAISKVAEMRALDRKRDKEEEEEEREREGMTNPPWIVPNGHDYLLTGLSLFTTHEPCVYCCMALVHSRVKNVHFLLPSPGRGGLCGSDSPREDQRCKGMEDGGPYPLQEIGSLNHSFHVWRWVGEDLKREGEVDRAWKVDSIRNELDLTWYDP